MVGGRPTLLAACGDGVHGIAQRHARLQVERNGDRREQALVVDGKRRELRPEMRERVERHLAAAGRAHVNIAQGLRILPEFRRDFHHHVILVQRRVHGGYLALAEGIVERGVDQLRRNAEARGRGAVVLHPGLQAAVLLVAVHVGDDGNGAQLLVHAGRVRVQVVHVVAAHGELV